MSGDPTDAQLLTCKARGDDVSTFPRALANQIDANYGNYIYFLFIFQRQSTWSLIIISCIMVVACKDNRPVACLIMKKVIEYISRPSLWGTSDWSLAMSFAVACICICMVACICICMVACRSTGLTTCTLWEARGVSSYLQHRRRL